MNNYTPEQIQEAFDRLAPEMQTAISSPDIATSIQAIGNANGLMIDQVGALVDQVGLVMLGLANASTFVAEVSRRLNIDPVKAKKIAGEINTQVFDAIKKNMRATEESRESQATEYAAKPVPINRLEEPHEGNREEHIASIEKAGGFTVERHVNLDKATDPDIYGPAGDKVEHPDHILEHIETPRPAPRRTEPHIEPLVETLLKTPTAIPAEKIVRRESATPPATPPVPQPPVNLPTGDPYREAVN